MEIDKFKNALSALDQRLNQQVAVEDRIIQPAGSTMHRSLRPLATGQFIQAVVGLLSILVGLAAWRSDLGDFGGLFVSGVAVHIYGVAMIALAVMTRIAIRKIDEAGPVSTVQRSLAELRRLNITAGYVLGMTWWVLWVPFSIVIFHILTGVNLFALGSTFAELMVGAGIVGFLCSAGLHRWAAISGRTRLAAIFDNILTGSSLRNAQKQLEDIKLFQRD